MHHSNDVVRDGNCMAITVLKNGTERKPPRLLIDDMRAKWRSIDASVGLRKEEFHAGHLDKPGCATHIFTVSPEQFDVGISYPDNHRHLYFNGIAVESPTLRGVSGTQTLSRRLYLTFDKA